MTVQREAELIELVLKGSCDAFEEFVIEYEKKVYNIAYKTLGSREDAEDVTQEAFLRAYTSLAGFNSDSRFSTWLYRIVSNLCLDKLRKKQPASVPLTVENGDGEESELEIPDKSLSPELLLEEKLTRESVRKGILSLEEPGRQMLLLREIQGMSYDEIAKTLDVELGTVKSRIFRARKKLCAFLIKDGNIPEEFSSKQGKGGLHT